jgi:hypothetical protein
MIGPPSDTPQRLSGWTGPTGAPSTVSPRMSLLPYSYQAVPWKWFEPLLVTTLTEQPEKLPYSVSNGANCTWVSRTASYGMGVELREEKPVSLRP